MRINVKVIDAGGVERGGTALYAMNNIAFLQKQVGQMGTVLTGDASD